MKRSPSHSSQTTAPHTGRIVTFVLGALAVLFVAAFLALRFAVYSPATIVPGENLCLIGYYRLDEQGLDGFKDLIERSRGMTEEYTVAFFEAELDEHGAVKTFALSLDTFENGDYSGVAVYSYADRSLTYDPPAQNGSSLVNTPNPNSTLDYLSEQLKRIPLADQISASGLERFVLQYRPHTLIDENTPIFDGRGKDSFPILDTARYNAGEGGTSDGNTNVVFRLYNGWSTVEGQQYLYVFDPLEAETAEGDPVAIMQCDYAISGGTLKFTKTHGQRWIESDLTETELAETLDFYRSGLYLPPASVFISPDDSLPIAYFYGGAPTLKLTFDEGETWSTVPLATAAEYGRAVTKRAIGFVSPQFGYAALGTDWSMGAGEHKMCYFTFDGGQTWSAKGLPLTMTSSTLEDMAMVDERQGVVALSSGLDGSYPLLYATADTGDTWNSIELPYESLPPEIQYLSNVDGISYRDGSFFLVMGQGDTGTMKATFTATDLVGPWQILEITEETIHNVG
ncbi:WD40/YVTN/BNR-like repeat-containing protein [Raoultibacter timonensis]|uniref:WD40/YVTN/BNR-like repeat-containing protein n=1 Tax=Raoultibacter timonensis TaxID=1907662 RepID=UPI0026DAFD7E|nr:hypothetical protein [Raoultibacter timonensis]